MTVGPWIPAGAMVPGTSRTGNRAIPSFGQAAVIPTGAQRRAGSKTPRFPVSRPTTCLDLSGIFALLKLGRETSCSIRRLATLDHWMVLRRSATSRSVASTGAEVLAPVGAGVAGARTGRVEGGRRGQYRHIQPRAWRRSLRLPGPGQGPLEPRGAPPLRGGAAAAGGGRRPGRRHRRRDRRAHGPFPQGQVHRPRRAHRRSGVVGQQRRDDAAAVRPAARRLPRPCRGQGALRAGPLRRRRQGLPRQDPRLHRVCLALAVHPQPADPPGGGQARGLRARPDDRRPAELQGRSGPPWLPHGDGDRLRLHAARSC